MAFTNKETKEINCKVLLFGNESGHRKALLNHLKRMVNKEFNQGSFDSIKSTFSPFEFIPVSVGHIRDYNVKLHIFSVSLEDNFDSTLSILLKGVDLVSFVIDSDVASMADNMTLMTQCDELFKRHQLNINAIPKIYVYNYQHKNTKMPVDILRREFNADGNLEVEWSEDTTQGSNQLLEKYSQLALDQLLRSI